MRSSTCHPEERASRIANDAGLCAIRTHDAFRCFVRVVLPVPIRGEGRHFCWGLWVETPEADFEWLHDHWRDPNQATRPPFAGTLANAIPFQPASAGPTVGLPGTVRLRGPRLFAKFKLVGTLEHPFAVEQRDGIHVERLLEYLSPALHRSE